MITLYLVGENHTKDEENHKKIKEYCKSQNVIFSTEHFRDEAQYQARECDVGDLICDLHSSLCILYLGIKLNNGTVDSSAVAIITRIFDYILINSRRNNNKLACIENMRLFYEESYGWPHLYERLLVEYCYLNGATNKDEKLLAYEQFIQFLSEIITNNKKLDCTSWILHADNIFSEYTNDAYDGLYDRVQLEVRDQIFAHYISELVGLTKTASGDKLVIILGKKHLPGVMENLGKLNIKDIAISSYSDPENFISEVIGQQSIFAASDLFPDLNSNTMNSSNTGHTLDTKQGQHGKSSIK